MVLKNYVLVTGGGRRLGAEICLALAEKGHALLIHYYKQADAAAEVAKKCRAIGVKAEAISGDFSTQSSTQQFVEACRARFLKVRSLVNNLGSYAAKSALETTPEEWESLFQSNLHAPRMLIDAFLPEIIEQKGRIITLGIAGVGVLQADVRRTAYRMAKTSLYLLTKALARELAPQQVCVNMVSPGYLENSVDLPGVWPVYSMQRPGLLKEAARVVAFLMEEESCYITGQNIEVAGGVAL
jgi:NAD(P)-dependent dehydrogenase (short-subunit alcohol dehydrogenase family)